MLPWLQGSCQEESSSDEENQEPLGHAHKCRILLQLMLQSHRLYKTRRCKAHGTQPTTNTFKANSHPMDMLAFST